MQSQKQVNSFLLMVCVLVFSSSCAKKHSKQEDEREEIRFGESGGVLENVGGTGGEALLGGLDEAGAGAAGEGDPIGGLGGIGLEDVGGAAGEAGQEPLMMLVGGNLGEGGSGGELGGTEVAQNDGGGAGEWMVPQGGSAGEQNAGFGGDIGPIEDSMGGVGGEEQERLIPRDRTMLDGYLSRCIPSFVSTEECGEQYVSEIEPELVHPNHWQIKACLGASLGVQNTCGKRPTEYTRMIQWVVPDDGDYLFEWTRYASMGIRSVCDDVRTETECGGQGVLQLHNVQAGDVYFLILGKGSATPTDVTIDIYHADWDTPPQIEEARIRIYVSPRNTFEDFELEAEEYETQNDVSFTHYFRVRNESWLSIESFNLEFLDTETNEPIPLSISGGDTRIEYPVLKPFGGAFRLSSYTREGSSYFLEEVPEYPLKERAELYLPNLRLPMEVRGGRSNRAFLRVRNEAGIESAPFEVEIARQESVGPGELCDPNYFISACEGLLYCNPVEEAPVLEYRCGEPPDPEPEGEDLLLVNNIRAYQNGHRVSLVLEGLAGDLRDSYSWRFSFRREDGSTIFSEFHYLRPWLNIEYRNPFEEVVVFQDRRLEALDHIDMGLFTGDFNRIRVPLGEYQVVEPEPFPVVREGEACDSRAALNECELGTVCKAPLDQADLASCRCIEEPKPNVESVALFREEDFTLHAIVRVRDENRNQVALRFRAQKEGNDDNGDAVIEPLAEIYYPTDVIAVGENLFEMYVEIEETEGALSVSDIALKVIDKNRVESEWVEVDGAQIRMRSILEQNTPCDSRSFENVCEEGLECREHDEGIGHRCLLPEALEGLEIQSVDAFLDVDYGVLKLKVRSTKPFYDATQFYFSWEGADIVANARVPRYPFPRQAEDDHLLSFDHVRLHPEAESPHDRLLEKDVYLTHYNYFNRLDDGEGGSVRDYMTPDRWRTVEAIELVLRDEAGNETEPVRVPVVQPERLALGQVCDLENERVRCSEDAVCGALGEDEEATCQDATMFSTCEDGWMMGDLNYAEVDAPDEPAGVYWYILENAEGEYLPTPSPRAVSHGSCETLLPYVLKVGPHIYRFTAPLDGTYRWAADWVRSTEIGRDFPVKNLSIRTHCGAAETELACGHFRREDPDTGQIVEVDPIEVEAVLEAGQTVYVFVDGGAYSPSVDDFNLEAYYGLSVHYLGP